MTISSSDIENEVVSFLAVESDVATTPQICYSLGKAYEWFGYTWIFLSVCAGAFLSFAFYLFYKDFTLQNLKIENIFVVAFLLLSIGYLFVFGPCSSPILLAIILLAERF